MQCNLLYRSKYFKPSDKINFCDIFTNPSSINISPFKLQKEMDNTAFKSKNKMEFSELQIGMHYKPAIVVFLSFS